MSTLTFCKKHIKGHAIGEASRFPLLSLHGGGGHSEITLDEDDELFLDYGAPNDRLPFTNCDNYDGPLQDLEFEAAVLENSHVRAEIVISLGGRLWSIYDKDAKRELLANNHQFLPGNLAIRNAWFAGGIEYNIGFTGHDPQTCATRFAAETADDDGTPVLRIYEFGRYAQTPFQIDFFLPDDSKFLFARMRVTNPSENTVPLYWWSNIAVEEQKGARVILPAFEAYTHAYVNGQCSFVKIKLPDGEGFDGTFPTNHPAARDYFFRIPEENRKFETVIYPDGNGFAFCSTKRLLGRKLFVWGQNNGAHHWQRRLMAQDSPDYIEIQGGIAHTQGECIPMPPKTAWEWLEAYGPITMDPEKCFGDWKTAVEAVSEKMDAILPQEKLDALHKRTHDAISMKYAKARVIGSGWGALENLRYGKNIAPQLDFGSISEEQKDWKELLDTGAMDDEPPKSYMAQDEWFELLKKAKPGWKVLMHLALNYYHRLDYERANECIAKSLCLNQNAWNLSVQALFHWQSGRKCEASALYQQALALVPDDASFAKATLRAIAGMEDYRSVVNAYNYLAESIKAKPLVKFLYATAIAHLGQLKEAEDILLDNGGLEVPDICEGEIATSELYIYIQSEKARLAGKEFDPKKVDIPFALDWRMSN